MSFLRASSPRPFLRLDISSPPDDEELAAATAIRVDHVSPQAWSRTRFAWYRCGLKDGGNGLLELNLRGVSNSSLVVLPHCVFVLYAASIMKRLKSQYPDIVSKQYANTK